MDHSNTTCAVCTIAQLDAVHGDYRLYGNKSFNDVIAHIRHYMPISESVLWMNSPKKKWQHRIATNKLETRYSR